MEPSPARPAPDGAHDAGAAAPARPRALVEAGYGLGDVVEATPTCHALHLLGFDVDFLVQRPDALDVAALFRGHPALAHVFADERDVEPSRYDVGVGCHGPTRVVPRLPPGASFRVTLGDIARDGLLEAGVRIARALGYDAAPPPHPLALPAARADVAPDTVVVHAGSDPRSSCKRWPHWEALCARLRAQGHPLLVVGTPDDESPTRWERRHAHRFDLSLVALATILRDARAYLGNDSGVSHLAGAVGVPGVVLFGPTDPRVYAPRSAALRILAVPPREGEGFHPFDATFPSLARLDLETVARTVQAALDDPRRTPEPSPPPRRPSPRGHREARPPSAAEIAATPATLDATDTLFRTTTAAGVLGALARRDAPRELEAWRHHLARTLGLVHLRAAAARRAQGTPTARRRARSHLRHAWRAGWRVRAWTQRVALELTPRRAGFAEGQAPR